jgi:hypothetical protein
MVNNMKPAFTPRNVLIYPFLFSLLVLAFPRSALAALAITSVSPNTISNTQVNSITITGEDFQESTVVTLEIIGNLVTNFASATTLSAQVPAGIPAGIYSVTVTNPDSTAVTLPNALTITDQALEPTATNTPPASGYERPVVVMLGYTPNIENISPGEVFTLYVTLYNAGQHYATNVVANFATGTIIPQGTGGVIAVGDIAPSNRVDFAQPLIVSTDFWGSLATGDMAVTYTDQSGQSYNERFTISIPIYRPYVPGASPTPTSTTTPTPSPTPSPTPHRRPQLVITNYVSSISPLQPGSQFALNLTVSNNGYADAQRVTMIVGGGSASSSGAGTPDSSGISGASGEFTNFAPIGSSNIQTLGDLQAGYTLEASQTLIVNVSTNPGAYPLRISFVYVDEFNNPYIDEQVITLLVLRLPNIDVNFYRDPGPIFAGQENILPIQVVNLGRNSVVLGNMQVETINAQMVNNNILVGTLESGGYFTLDASFIPNQPGMFDLIVSIAYTDDFNQAQVISQTISVEVLEMFIPEPGTDGSLDGGVIIPDVQPETFLQKVWRFILGLLGLDSGVTTTSIPSDVQILEQPAVEIVPAQPLKGP